MSSPGVRFNLPFLHGLYVAFNAIPDAYFLGDGPSCVFAKAEHIHYRHDQFSTLSPAAAIIASSTRESTSFNIAGNFEAEISSALKRIAGWRSSGVIFTGAMPMCAVAGTDYERILRDALAGCGKPAFLIPRRSVPSPATGLMATRAASRSSPQASISQEPNPKREAPRSWAI